jgi:hypothetical protein
MSLAELWAVVSKRRLRAVLAWLGSLLDLDGDGNPLDDIIGMAGKTGALKP